VSDPVDKRPLGIVPSRGRLLTGQPGGMRRGVLQRRYQRSSREKKGAMT
jgi:hypothetical protein